MMMMMMMMMICTRIWSKHKTKYHNQSTNYLLLLLLCRRVRVDVLGTGASPGPLSVRPSPCPFGVRLLVSRLEILAPLIPPTPLPTSLPTPAFGLPLVGKLVPRSTRRWFLCLLLVVVVVPPAAPSRLRLSLVRRLISSPKSGMLNSETSS